MEPHCDEAKVRDLHPKSGLGCCYFHSSALNGPPNRARRLLEEKASALVSFRHSRRRIRCCYWQFAIRGHLLGCQRHWQNRWKPMERHIYWWASIWRWFWHVWALFLAILVRPLPVRHLKIWDSKSRRQERKGHQVLDRDFQTIRRESFPHFPCAKGSIRLSLVRCNFLSRPRRLINLRTKRANESGVRCTGC